MSAMNTNDGAEFTPEAIAQVIEIVLLAFANQLDRPRLQRDLADLAVRGEGVHEPGVREVVVALAAVLGAK